MTGGSVPVGKKGSGVLVATIGGSVGGGTSVGGISVGGIFVGGTSVAVGNDVSVGAGVVDGITIGTGVLVGITGGLNCPGVGGKFGKRVLVGRNVRVGGMPVAVMSAPMAVFVAEGIGVTALEAGAVPHNQNPRR